MTENHKTTNPSIFEFHLDNDALNQKIEAHVREEMKRDAGLESVSKHSNIGGWHSKRDLDARLGDGSPQSNLLLKLFASFSDPITEYISSQPEAFNVPAKSPYDWNYAGAWFNVAVKGGYNAPHTHPGCQISGAYYVRAEQPSEEFPYSGRIDFIENNVQYGFFPKPGTLFLFPSHMLHWVHPYQGSEIRICLSFNAKNVRLLKEG